MGWPCRPGQQRCVGIILALCLLGNVLLVLRYLTSRSHAAADVLTDDNGVPLFLHEPFDDDRHRNNLEHAHHVRLRLQHGRNDGPGRHHLVKKRHFPDTNRSMLHVLSEHARRQVLHVDREEVAPPSLLRAGTPSNYGGQGHAPVTNQGYVDGLQLPWTGEQGGLDFTKIKALAMPSSCRGQQQQQQLVVVVCSAAARFELRAAIRETWGRAGVSLVFVVGRAADAGSPLLSRQVETEVAEQGDVLLLDMEERYTLLTYKTLAAFSWVLHHCSHGATHLLKADDDVFINVPNLRHELRLMEDSLPGRFMLGHVIDGAKPITARQDKWYLGAGQFRGGTYPTYLSGSAYVFPTSLLKPLLHEAQQTQPFWIEDVFISGVLAQRLKAVLIHNSKFEYQKSKFGPCHFRSIISAHQVSPADLRRVWAQMGNQRLNCGPRVFT